MVEVSRTATPFGELQASRAWLDHEIAKIRIPARIGAAPDAASDSTSGAAPGSGDENPDANAPQDGRSPGEALRRELDALSIVQLALLSKLSVEPSSFDGFFHLAGTSFLKWRISRRLGLPRHAAASRALVESSSRYLADLNAMDPRTRQIEALLLRMKALQD